jgi:hypothetical protein
MARRLAVVLAVIGGAAALAAWASRFPTFRLFFAWPQGGTWSNAIEQAEGAVLITLVGWAARDHIGRKLAAWWDRHAGPHAVKRHKQALREHEAGKQEGGAP